MSVDILDARLTDSVERDLASRAYEQTAQLRPLDAALISLSAITRAARAVISYIAAVNDGMNDARRASTHYTGSQW